MRKLDQNEWEYAPLKRKKNKKSKEELIKELLDKIPERYLVEEMMKRNYIVVKSYK